MNYLNSFLLNIAFLILSFTITSLSAFGLGKYDKDTSSSGYKASITFLCIGLVMSTASIVFIHDGNVISSYCKEAIGTITA